MGNQSTRAVGDNRISNMIEQMRKPANLCSCTFCVHSVEDLDRMHSRFLEDIREGREARAESVEDILRTQMLNGTAPADLEKAADLEWQLIKERREARRAAAAAEASEVLGAFAKQKAVDDTANEIISAVTLPITDLNRSKIKTTLWGLLARFT